MLHVKNLLFLHIAVGLYCDTSISRHKGRPTNKNTKVHLYMCIDKHKPHVHTHTHNFITLQK